MRIASSQDIDVFWGRLYVFLLYFVCSLPCKANIFKNIVNILTEVGLHNAIPKASCISVHVVLHISEKFQILVAEGFPPLSEVLDFEKLYCIFFERNAVFWPVIMLRKSARWDAKRFLK